MSNKSVNRYFRHNHRLKPVYEIVHVHRKKGKEKQGLEDLLGPK